ncbi:hypothetical protein JW960_15310 [candidate division KSB1 bacterium]|nr:hypothetical protein [candidate division KSB1 bacterium]
MNIVNVDESVMLAVFYRRLTAVRDTSGSEINKPNGSNSTGSVADTILTEFFGKA